MTRFSVSKLSINIFLVVVMFASHLAIASENSALQELIFVESQYNKAIAAGQSGRALEWAKQGYDMAVQHKMDYSRMFFAGYIGSAAEDTGDFVLSHNARTIQKELAIRFNNGTELWYALNGLGIASWRQKRLEEALEWHTRAISQARKIKDKIAEDSSRSNRGLVYKGMGLIDQARQDYETSLSFARKNGNKSGEAIVLNSMGNLYLSSNPALAKKHFESALVIYRKHGTKRDIAIVLGNIGGALHNMGRIEEALDYEKQALQASQEIGDKYNEWLSSKNIAISFRKLGRFKEAAEYQAHANFLKRQGGF